MVALSEAHTQDCAAELCAGRALGVMAFARKVRHNTICATPSLHGERFIGWLCHYLIGIAFAAVPLVSGADWFYAPSGDSAAVRGRNLIRAVLDPAARIWFWRRGLTDSPTMAGAFAEPAGAPPTASGCIWRRALIELWRCQLIFNLIKQGN